MLVMGLDIGSNSVGSACVDTDRREVFLAASIFPAGVDEQEDKRGAPRNQARRQVRSQRRTIARRAERKRRLVRFLLEQRLLPADAAVFQSLLDRNPWELRRKALTEPLTPHEFGRVALHLAQRRGAVGIQTDPDDPEEGKVKEGIDRLNALMKQRGASTVGQLMADLMVERRRRNGDVEWREPIRNRQYRTPEDVQLYAGRELLRAEFHEIVERQRKFEDTELARLLTDDFVRTLDNPAQTDTWRHQGLLFGQRRTYWDTGTLGRCVLEPTERCVPIADRHASYFRVVETVNNFRIQRRGELDQPLCPEQRAAIIRLLRGPLGVHAKGKHAGKPKTTVSVSEIREALGLPRRKGKADPVQLNIESDEEREINTDWFHREIAHGVFGENAWNHLTEPQREAVNRAVLRFDPDHTEDCEKLRTGAARWWNLDAAAVERLIAAWKARPKLEKRLNLSRRAILNLLPLMEKFDAENNRWPTQQEARKAHANSLPPGHARQRYATGAPGLTAADRYFMKLRKHQIADGIPELPPAPMLSNPVVRKAIHEVRRHLQAWLRRFRRKPDRVVIELARITKQSERQRNAALARNRLRENIRRQIINDVLPDAFGQAAAARLSLNQQRAAVDRVVLARQQTHLCPYCAQAGLTDPIAARGDGLEIDHIVPYSRCGDDGMNNKVLVHQQCNRGKGNQTPREWWGNAFDERVRFAEKLFRNAEPAGDEYFDRRDCARKWLNFTREIREGEEFKNSQLTDTAYAARQIAAYLADALFDGRGLPERGDGLSQQRIFFTTGRITFTLRKDWQLFETLKPPARDGRHGELTAAEELALAEKNRGDHRQHAIDAAVIALTSPDIKHRLATWAARAAEEKEKLGRWPRRLPEPPPWGDVPTFRKQVLSRVYPRFDSGESQAGMQDVQGDSQLLIVSHRPVKRRLVGAFHEATHYGPVIGPLPPHRTENAETLFTNRISADRLKPNHLRVPAGWDALSAKLDDAAAPRSARDEIRRQLADMTDPPPAKSGIVRDRALRDRIRKCLRANGIDPDAFSPAQIRRLVAERKLTMASGVPIKGVVLLRTNTDPVVIPRKRWNPLTNQVVADEDPRTRRVYIGGNNHHIEIREQARSGKWFGEVVSTFEAAKRVRTRRLPAVDRSDTQDAQFVMSLAEGEMIFARREDRPKEPPDYFVVCKLDKLGNSCRVHFAPHWDARQASEQDRWDVAPADLKNCGPELGQPPVKVRVGPLGDATPLERD